MSDSARVDTIPVENPSFYFSDRHPIDETEEAFYFIAQDFLFRAPKPLVPGGAELLSTDTRPFEQIMADDQGKREHDAYFPGAVAVYAWEGQLYSLHQKPDGSTIECPHQLTRLSPSGGQRQVMAELHGLSGHSWRHGDRLYLTRYTHDDENRRGIELISLSLATGRDALHGTIRPTDVADTAYKDRIVAGLTVVSDRAYISVVSIKDDDEWRIDRLRVDLETGEMRSFSDEVEAKLGRQLGAIYPYEKGLLLMTREGQRDLHEPTDAYRSTLDFADVARVYSASMGQQLYCDGKVVWRGPTALSIAVNSFNYDGDEAIRLALKGADLSLEALDADFRPSGLSLQPPLTGWPDIGTQFAFGDGYALAMTLAGDVLMARLPSEETPVVVFETLHRPAE